ncbi:hypothetical protein, variant 1 [Aphanomyces astaci]|uniref:DIRP domain-containing protein n=1 Tax=Aphanomyces astaci TaxID=112090 RepID=W4FVI4_APHAT|nr:hypothetical protein, variant 1 [Aphanomyces astaci]ETV70638.1 hypothetical protein, variant 1 [Aphanomyces astaci]|eukprot:XP_009839701.1 hypothetical protein, variant 1 [Aphanomyces astaci]
MGWSERLGPRWTESEVTEFFSLWRQHDATTASLDRVVAAVSTELPQRTPDMVRALIQMHKGFLSLPMATDEGLYAILTDHYDAQAAWESEAAEKQQQQQVVAASSSRRKVSRRNNVQYVRSFSAAIDDEFFAHSEFHDCLVQMNMGHFQRAKRTEWSAIRGSMGHPRRFSATFLKEERQKLLRYRNVVRYAQRMNEFPVDIRFPYKIYSPLKVGAHVRVLHPKSRHLCVGVVCAVHVHDNAYDVLLPFAADHKEILRCPDTSVMLLRHDDSHGITDMSLLYWQQATPKADVAPSFPLEYDQHGGGDLADATGMAMRAVTALLQRKEQLVMHLSRMNDQAATMSIALPNTDVADENDVVQQFQSQYAWVLVNLDTTNHMLASALYRMQLPSPHHAVEDQRLQDDAADAALNVQQLEWAHQYMHAAHERSRNLVAGTIRRLTMDERCKDTLQMPQLATSELIMSCMDMVLTLQCAVAKVPLPPMVVHKLLDRNLELLKPRAHANMTLYHEMVQSIQVLKSVLLTHHQNSPP